MKIGQTNKYFGRGTSKNTLGKWFHHPMHFLYKWFLILKTKEREILLKIGNQPAQWTKITPRLSLLLILNEVYGVEHLHFTTEPPNQ